ncbi:MAG: branched-chain amino acid ABC transporter substrate-binding protein, partial [Chloroflexota bacterium]
ASLAQKLATDRAVLGVVGPMDSGSALRAGPALDAGHLAFISQSASSSKMTESGWRTAHRLVARDDLEGPADAGFLFGPPAYAKNVYVVDSQDLDSTGLADEFEKRAKALGIKTERDSLPATDDYSAEIAKVKAAKPDALFFPSRGSRCEPLLQELRKQSAAFKLMSTAGCHDAAVEGLFVSDADPTPEGQAWAKDYKAKYGADPAPFSANAYDAVRIILQAIRNAAAVKGSLDIKPGDVNAEIGKTSGFKGLSGPILFDAKGDLVNPALSIYQVIGGTFKKLAP